MKTATILIAVIILMQMATLVNVTLFDGAWNGIVMMLSTFLFMVGMITYYMRPDRAKNA